MTVTARLSSALSSQVVIPVTITDDTAESNDHGTLTSITIASGATSGRGMITTNHDADDVDETFTVSLGTLPSEVTAGWPSSVQVQIRDDERIPQVTLKVKPNPVDEGASFKVEAHVSATVGVRLRIPVTVRSGTAEDVDWGERIYPVYTYRIKFSSAGNFSTGQVRIPTHRDSDLDDETLIVEVDEANLPDGYAAGTPSSLTVTIRDLTEPSGPPVSLQVERNVPEGTEVSVTVFVSPPQPNAVTIPLTVTRGTSEEDDHGTLASITIPANANRKTEHIRTFADADDEDETFTVAIDVANLPEGLVAGGTTSVEVTIHEGEPPPPQPPPQPPRGVTLSSNANLSGLTASSGTSSSASFTALALTPSTFSAGTTSYAATVANTITHVKLTPTVQDTGKASVAVNGATVSSGTASAAIALGEGANAITVRVTAEDGATKDYTVTVTRQAAALSSNANLSGLTASSNTRASGTFAALALTPSTFSAGTTSYTANVANTITHVKLTPTVQDTGKASVAVDGSTVTSGSPSAAIALDEGANAITVRVTAEDGATKDYAVTVTRQAAALSSNANLSGLTGATSTDGTTFGGTLTLTPSTFSATTTSYTATVANTITHVKLTPTVQDTGKASVAVDGSTVSSGTASAAIALDEGANAITVRVTAEDGTTKDYTVTVTRQAAALSSNANLSGLTASSNTRASGTFAALALTPSTFSAGTTSYAATVANTITHVKLTPTVQDTGKATVAVDGSTVSSGTASAAIALDEGANAITVRVTAEDGTKDYTVTVTRQAAALSSNANLSGLTASSGTSSSASFTALALTPSFSAETTSYTATVANTITHVKLTPTVQDTGKASVAVNGSTVRSGSPSAAIALGDGANAITVRVTAENGTTKDYTVTVTRQAAALSSNANLSGLTASSGTSSSASFTALALTPSFSAETTSYTATVANTITHVKLTPTVQDTGKASVAVNGSTVRSGSPSAAIALGDGANAITVRVTAEDGTTKDYTVTVTRQAATQSSDASLSGLLVSAGTLTPSFSAETTSYAVAVEHAVERVKLTPTANHAGATVTVNGAEVASGSASGSISLSVGENLVAVVVTAEDGTTRTYRVTVTRGEKVLGPEEKALVDKVGKALLGRDDPGEYPAEGASNR